MAQFRQTHHPTTILADPHGSTSIRYFQQYSGLLFCRFCTKLHRHSNTASQPAPAAEHAENTEGHTFRTRSGGVIWRNTAPATFSDRLSIVEWLTATREMAIMRRTSMSERTYAVARTTRLFRLRQSKGRHYICFGSTFSPPSKMWNQNSLFHAAAGEQGTGFKRPRKSC